MKTCLAKSFEGSGCMYLAITDLVSVSVDITNGSSAHVVQNALRTVWLRLCYDYATIASSFGYNTEREKYVKTYTNFHAEHIDLQIRSWVSQTFFLITSSMTGLEWCSSSLMAPKHLALFVVTPPYTNGSIQALVRRDSVFRSPQNTRKFAEIFEVNGRLVME